MNAQTAHDHGPGRLRFGVFEIDLASEELTKRGGRVRLLGKPLQVLAALVERPGELVSREQLRQRLWPDETFVDFDNNLNAAVRKLRQALGDSADSPRFVETLPRRGYRFIAQVDPVGGVGARSGVAPARRLGLWLALGVAGVSLLVAGWTLKSRDPVAPATPVERVMLAVMPFQNLDEDPRHEFFCDGLTEEMITQLGRLQPERLGVIARISSMTYKNTDKTVDVIGRELGVDHVLEGSVRASGDRIRITAQLIQVSDQTHLWAETYDARLDDLLQVQGDVAVQVARVLALELLPDQPLARARAGTRVTKAYEHYMRGRYEWNRFSSEGYANAVTHFKQAIALDPDYAAAWAGLANTYNLQSFSSELTPAAVFPEARRAAERALAIDDRSAEAHAALAFGLLYYDYDLEGADREFRRSIELSPNYAMAYHWRAGALSALERHDEAIAAMRHAVELDPVSLSVLSDAAWYYLFADRHQQAIDESLRTLEIADYGWARACLRETYFQMGRYEETLRLVRDGMQQPIEDPQVEAALALSDAGSTLEALQELWLASKQDDETLKRRYPVELAFAHAAVGNVDDAFVWLERAYELRDAWLVFLRVDPRFDPLSSDPRFEELARRVGLPDGRQ